MNRLVFIVTFALTASPMVAQAQVPELPDVPAGLNDGISAVLAKGWAALKQRLSSAQSAAEKLREDCTGVAKGTPEAADCRSRQGRLISLRNEYSHDVIEFRDSIRLISGEETEPLKAIRIFGLKMRGEVYLYDGGSRTRKRGIFSTMADRIKTGPNSRFEGALPDGTRIIIGPNSDIEISTYVYNLKKNEIRLNKIKGILRSIVTSGGSRRFQLRTSKACACVRGTDFVIEGSENSEIGSVTVLEGKVSIEGPMQPQAVSVSSGQVVYLRDDGTIESIQDVGEVALLRDLLQRYPDLSREDKGS